MIVQDVGRICCLRAGVPGQGGFGEGRLSEDVVSDLLSASRGGGLRHDGCGEGDGGCGVAGHGCRFEERGADAREAAPDAGQGGGAFRGDAGVGHHTSDVGLRAAGEGVGVGGGSGGVVVGRVRAVGFGGRVFCLIGLAGACAAAQGRLRR